MSPECIQTTARHPGLFFPDPTGSFGLNKSTSVGDPTPHSILVVRSWRQAHGTRRLAGRSVVQSACPSAPYSPRSCVPQPPEGKRAKTHTIQRRRLCTFSRSVPTLYFVQFASFAHFFCCTVLPYAPSTSMQVSGTYGQRLLFSFFAERKRTRQGFTNSTRL